MISEDEKSILIEFLSLARAKPGTHVRVSIYTSLWNRDAFYSVEGTIKGLDGVTLVLGNTRILEDSISDAVTENMRQYIHVTHSPEEKRLPLGDFIKDYRILPRVYVQPPQKLIEKLKNSLILNLQ